MLNNSEVQPALTAEEWQEALRPQSEYRFYSTRGDVLLGWATSEAQELGQADPSYALGAYALYRSGHGFTREDVRLLIWANHALDDEGVETAACLKLAELAARIEALLPPG